MRRIVSVLPIVLACVTSVLAQSNTVVFDNQSGEPALVKLIGRTAKEIDVPTGSKGTVTAAAGHYRIKVRYGASGNFRYSKGEDFEVTETATATSETTITLHKVVAGNYASQPSTQSEFEADAQLPGRPATEGDTRDAARAAGEAARKDAAAKPPRPESFAKPVPGKLAAKTVDAFATGMPYFIWPTQPGPVALSRDPSTMSMIELEYAVNPKITAPPFSTRLVLSTKEASTGEVREIQTMGVGRPDGITWRARAVVMPLDSRFLSGSGKARVYLVEDMGKQTCADPRPISNVLDVDAVVTDK